MHKAVPSLHLSGDIEKAMVDFLSIWGDRPGDEKRNTKRAISQLLNYHNTHKDNKSLFKFLPPPEGTIEVEEDTSPLEIPVAVDVGLSVPIIARIDGWVEHRDTGETWGWEFKTASRIDAKFFDSFEMNCQILTYALALRTLTSRPVKGFMVEGMLIDKNKVDNIVQPVLTPDHLIEDIKQWLNFWGSMLLGCEKQYLETSNVTSFPKNFAGCTAYPHYYISSWPCDFTNLCRVADYKSLLPMYQIVPDHKFVKVTSGETDA
jgi:hypothetical protein